jgi:predicted nucleic acid-binding protein
VIGVDTSVLVRYLVGTPAGEARRAAALIDDDENEIGIPVVALAECAHVLRTQYDIDQRTIIETLIELVQRANVHVLGVRSDLLVGLLARARSMPGRPIPDAMIVASVLDANALPLATYDGDQRRYGIQTRTP